MSYYTLENIIDKVKDIADDVEYRNYVAPNKEEFIAMMRGLHQSLTVSFEELDTRIKELEIELNLLQTEREGEYHEKGTYSS